MRLHDSSLDKNQGLTGRCEKIILNIVLCRFAYGVWVYLVPARLLQQRAYFFSRVPFQTS
jgi:hypothetical protein